MEHVSVTKISEYRDCEKDISKRTGQGTENIDTRRVELTNRTNQDNENVESEWTVGQERIIEDQELDLLLLRCKSGRLNKS